MVHTLPGDGAHEGDDHAPKPTGIFLCVAATVAHDLYQHSGGAIFIDGLARTMQAENSMVGLRVEGVPPGQSTATEAPQRGPHVQNQIEYVVAKNGRSAK